MDSNWIYLIIATILSFLGSAMIIYIVGMLNIGLKIDSFTTAILAALIIAAISFVIGLVLSLLGINLSGTIGAIIGLLISAAVLLLSDRFLKGMKVDGYGGAIIAAIAIAVISWLANWLGTQIMNLIS